MDEEPEESVSPRAQRRKLARILLAVLVVFSATMGILFVYAGSATPFFIVDGNSMQHGNETSHIGVMDTGDLVIVQSVESTADITTYIRGRATDFSTYGDYGDVLVYLEPNTTRENVFMHRAMAFVTWNATANAYDVPELSLLPAEDWDAWDANGTPTASPFGLSRFLLHRAGWKQDLDVHFNLTLGERSVDFGLGENGFLTMGDNNAYTTITRFDRWVIPLSYIFGRARGEIPWFGLIRLTLFPQGEACCQAWGSTDPLRGAPANSWLALNILLAVLVGAPLAVGLTQFYLARHPSARERLQYLWRRMRRRGNVGTSGSEKEMENDSE